MPARTPLALLAALLVLSGVAGCGLFGGSGPGPAATAFAQAWAKADDQAAAALTDDPAAAAALLRDTREQLAPTGLTVTVGQVREATDAGHRVRRRDVGPRAGPDVALPRRRWSWCRRRTTEFGWLVHWAPSVVHPAAGRPAAARASPPRRPSPAPVVDRGGRAVAGRHAGGHGAARPAAAGDLPAVTGALATALSPDRRPRSPSSRSPTAPRAPPTARPTPWRCCAARLRAGQDRRPRPAGRPVHQLRPAARPDAGFAQQVLPADPHRDGGRSSTGCPAGRCGSSTPAGNTVATLVEEAPKPGTAVGTRPRPRRPDRGRGRGGDRSRSRRCSSPSRRRRATCWPSRRTAPADAAGALALTGRFPPGSTFKIATAVAAVGTEGLTVDSPVACPGQTVIGGRPVPNEDRFDLGTVPLRTAFARSCNTTFAQLGASLGPDALPTAALQLGLGADYAVPGADSRSPARCPPSTDQVQRAENGFGQGQVLASPLGMALVAATVAHGAPVVPQLIRGQPTAVTAAATAPDPAVLDQVRTMMRAVVTEGTATAAERRSARCTARPAPPSSPARRPRGARLVRRLPRRRRVRRAGRRRRQLGARRWRWPAGSSRRLSASHLDRCADPGGHRTAAP